MLTLIFRHLKGSSARSALRWINLFAFLGLTLGIFAWISVISVMSGMQQQTKNRILSEKAHLIWEGKPRSDLKSKEAAFLRQWPAVLDRVDFVLQSEGLLESRGAHGDVRPLAGILIRGEEHLAAQDFILGRELLSLLVPRDSYGGSSPEAELRSLATVSLALRSVWDLQHEALVVKPSGYFQSGLYDIDRATVKLSRETLSKWLGLDNAVSHIEIHLKNPEAVDQYQAVFSEFLGVELKSWKQTEASLWYALHLEKVLMSLAVFFVILLAIFALYMGMAVRMTEKSQEIALLQALGAPRNQLQKLYMGEALVLALVATAMGVLLSWVFCRFLAGSFRLPDIYYSTDIPVDWSSSRALILSVTVILLALLSSWIPLRKALRSPIADTLRA